MEEEDDGDGDEAAASDSSKPAGTSAAFSVTAESRDDDEFENLPREFESELSLEEKEKYREDGELRGRRGCKCLRGSF